MPTARASRAATACALLDDVRVPRGGQRDRHRQDGAEAVDHVEAEEQRDAVPVARQRELLQPVDLGGLGHEEQRSRLAARQGRLDQGRWPRSRVCIARRCVAHKAEVEVLGQLQIIKAGLLMMAGVVLTVFVLAEFGFNLSEMFSRASEQHAEGGAYLQPWLQFSSKLELISFGLAFLLGTAGLPHILMRFFTVPDARAARSSVGWAVLLIGSFFVMVMVIGVGARAILGTGGEEAAGKAGNLAIPVLAEHLGGDGSTGGELFLAIVAAVALATILAVVAWCW